MPAVHPLLNVENLHVCIPTRKGELTALDGVSLTLWPGEVLGIVGESGAGKSVLGSAIIGLLDPPIYLSGGSIVLDGQRIDDLGPEELRRIRGAKIGMIFQDPLTSLDPLFTVGDQLIETIRVHTGVGRREASERAIQLLQETQIPGARERLTHYPHQFSGGMRQRVVIALALCAGPRVIIADEPTTALDVSVQAQIVALLRRVCTEHGTAMILITHDMGVIAETADRVAVMYSGRIVEEGLVDNVLKRPQHPYTRGLMNSIPPVNRNVDRLPQIDGAMPRLSAIPTGCAFHPRCPESHDLCLRERPTLEEHVQGRAACWLYQKVTS